MKSREATIHRVPHKREFTALSNRPINDASLSFKALGVLVYLLSKPDHWQARVSELVASHDEGEYAVKQAMGELTKAGYLVRRLAAHGRIEWEIHEDPEARDNRGDEAKDAEDQNRDNRDPEDAKTANLSYAKTAPLVSTEGLGSTDLASTEESAPSLSRVGAVSFDAFWSAYPRKVGKPAGERAFKAAVKRASAEVIFVGLARHVDAWRSWPKRDQQFIPHPSTWLNRDGWDDPVEHKSQPQSRRDQQADAIPELVDRMRGFPLFDDGRKALNEG